MIYFNKKIFLDELNKQGYHFETLNDVKAINIGDKVLIPTLLKYLTQIENEDVKEYIVRCLTKNGYTEVTGMLINEYRSSSNSRFKWAIGNALYIIRDSRFIDDYISIIKDSDNGDSRQMVVLLLGFVKSNKAKESLIQVLQEDFLTPHVIESLSRYQDNSIISLLEYFLVEDNGKSWIERIETLKKQHPDDPDYSYIETKAAWNYIKKQAIKAIKKLSKY